MSFVLITMIKRVFEVLKCADSQFPKNISIKQIILIAWTFSEKEKLEVLMASKF